jgi:tyrocidine synthetase III
MIIKEFQKIALQQDQKPAVIDAQQTLSYRQLNLTALTHAASIRALEPAQALPEDNQLPRAALLFEHGADMIIGILSALTANLIYVPLDVTYPPNRLLYILQNSGASYILTNNKNNPLAQELKNQLSQPIRIYNISDTPVGEDAPHEDAQVSRQESPDQYAYILYTSGSTGRPKGVVQNHRNALYYSHQWIKRFGITASDRMTLFSSFTHDGSVQDMFAALLSGAVLFPYNVKERTDITQLHHFLEDQKISIWHSVPSLYRYFSESLSHPQPFSLLRFVLLGGEPLREYDLELFNRHFPNSTLANVYGQTESSVNAICMIAPGDDFDKVTLGTPLDQTEMVLVAEDGEEVGQMAVGEILVVSDYIALQYWQDEENTQKVFDHQTEEGSLYWTGDLGRYTPDWGIKIIGRKDNQIKIRGFRVETGEIESVILRHDALSEAVVITRSDEGQDPYLCAYLVANREIPVSQLRDYLYAELPDYMVPRYFSFLQQIPLTGSGKIDRNRLPQPDTSPDQATPKEAPGNQTQQQLLLIWQEILGISDIGIHDNFMELGGHSLLIISLLGQIHQQLDVELQLQDVFENPSIAQLAELIKEAEFNRFFAIQPAETSEYYPLSAAQRRLFIIQQMDPQSIGYNETVIYRIKGAFDWRQLEQALKQMVQRHEILRTSLHIIAGQTVQKVHDSVPAPVTYMPADDTPIEEKIHALVQPFDLSQAPFLRLAVLQIDDNSSILVYDMHHLVVDGSSGRIFFRELLSLYAGHQLEPLKLQYKDYACWQNSQTIQASIKKQEEYWLDIFAQPVPPLELPLDFERPLIRRFEGSTIPFKISSQMTRDLKQIATQQETTIFMVLLALYNVLLYRLSGQQDLTIGTPVAGRRHADLQQCFGIFINTIVLRNPLHPQQPFTQFLNQVREVTLNAFENQDYPFGDLVDKVAIRRDTSRNPLFDVQFGLQNINTDKKSILDDIISDLDISYYPYRSGMVKLDLNLDMFDRGDVLTGVFEFSTCLYQPETIQRFIDYFHQLISSLIPDPDQPINQMQMIPENEKRRILYQFNDTQCDYPREKTIPQLLSEQSHQNPHRIAIIGAEHAVPVADDSSVAHEALVSISYLELHRQSDRLAGILKAKGVLPGAIVGLMPHRTVGMIIGLFAILKAGAAYLPIDPGYPEDRIRMMISDSGAQVLLTGDMLHPQYLHPELQELENDSPLPVISSQSLAYVTYTSGSTGRPKGVMITHQAILNFIKGITQQVDFTPNDIILSLTTISFDIFGLETLLPLSLGARIIIGTLTQQIDVAAAAKTLNRERVTIFQVTPSRLQLFIANPGSAAVLRPLKYLLVGGEAFPAPLLEKVRPMVTGKIINQYGPTETTIWSTLKDLTGDVPLNIGKPIANTQIFILNPAGAIQPIGVYGELYIGGDGLAVGYLNRPQLTAQRFNNKSLMTNGTDTSHMLYKTGDLARWLPDGNIEFIGRTDHQVKVRGYRIELGEVENQLLAHDDVKEVVVMVKEKGGINHLYAYVVNDGEFNASQLRQYLVRKLPDYMIPVFVAVEQIPLTPNGKVDRKALAHLDAQINLVQDYRAPENKIEQNIANIWKEVLQLEDVGVNHNFFDLGGNSMNLIFVASKLKETFVMDISIMTLFRYTTIKAMALYIKQLQEKSLPAAKLDHKEHESIDRGKNKLKGLKRKMVNK